MRPLLLSLLLADALLGPGRASAAPKLTLARDGRPAATIVLAAEPTQSAQFAATELQFHVKKITGALLPIAFEGEKVAGTRILVGESEATRALGVRAGDLRPQEYLIRFLPDTLVLLGRDDPVAKTGQMVPARAPGKFGLAAQFDGVHTAVSVAECGFDDDAGTMEAWIWMPAETREKHGTLLRLDGGGPWTYHILQRDAKSNRISYTTYDGAKGHGLASQPLSEGWHHVAGTHDAKAGKMALYVDGQLVSTTDYVKTTCRGATLGIGGIAADQGTVGNPFQGLIDEVRISRVVLSPEQMASGGAGALPLSHSPIPPLSASATCVYHFDEKGGLPRDSINPLANSAAPRIFASNGTLFAAYDFLERCCDVRWYAPGEVGVVCPSTPTLTVTGADRRHKPFMEMRWIAGSYLYMPTAQDRVPAADANVYRLRMRMGGTQRTCGHSFYGYYDRFLKDHPDWFAQGYTVAQPPQMCYTNEGFIRQVVQDARDYFDGKGSKSGAAAGDDTFGLVPMDNSSWCKCARCQAELNPAQKDNPQFNNGIASDYIFNFVNKVAREVRKTHPDKWIGTLAYSTYAYYPEKVKLEPNVSMQMCLHTRNWWCPSMEANDRKVLADWRKSDAKRPLFLWLYYCFPALNAKYGAFNYFPGFFAHSVVKQMGMYHKANVTGIYLENSSECDATWMMDQLEYYVTFKLADDPTLDGNRLIEEFFTRYYGRAAAPMKALYNRIEDLFGNPKYYPPKIQKSPAHQHQDEELAWAWVGTPERMAEMGKSMAQAKAAARSDLEKQRVALFEKGIWEYMVEGRRMYEEHKVKRAAAIPAVRVPRLPAAGDLAAPADLARVDWSKTADLNGWGTLAGDPARRHPGARAGHDGRYLFLELSDEMPTSRLVASDDVWTGDDFELFFAAQRDAETYQQLGVGPTGRLMEFTWAPAKTWKSGAVVACDTTSKTRWVMRLALPLNTLLPGGAKPGAKVYANFYRHTAGSDLLAWAPTFATGFHDTKRLPEFVLEP